MGNRARQINIGRKDREALEVVLRSRSETRQRVERAKIVLLCATEATVSDIAEELETYPNKVIFWRDRYAERGLAGLIDDLGRGRPTENGEEVRRKILELLETLPPNGHATWNGPLIAGKLKINVHAVWKILRKEGISLERHRSWCVSTDPEFAAKAADIVGLYLDPPLNAFVICVDEKPGIQALERKTGYVETSSGKVVRGYQSTYKRHGTLNLFAALEVATGKVQGKTSSSKKREYFLSFMESVVTSYPADCSIHVVLDNYSTHKRNDEWLAKHPNVTFHFTPTSASWLNQVEIWFCLLSRKALKGFSATSPADLRIQIQRFIRRTNQNPVPFKWKKRDVKNGQLKNTLANLRN